MEEVVRQAAVISESSKKQQKHMVALKKGEAHLTNKMAKLLR